MGGRKGLFKLLWYVAVSAFFFFFCTSPTLIGEPFSCQPHQLRAFRLVFASAELSCLVFALVRT